MTRPREPLGPYSNADYYAGLNARLGALPCEPPPGTRNPGWWQWGWEVGDGAAQLQASLDGVR